MIGPNITVCSHFDLLITLRVDDSDSWSYPHTMAMKRISQAAVAAILAVVILAGGRAVSAQENPDYTVPAPAVVVTAPPIEPIRSTPSAPAAPDQSPLPVTGSDIVQMLVIGAALIGGGAGLMALRRRSAH